MKKMLMLSMNLLVGSAAFAGPIFQDNNGYLYCEMVCKVNGSEEKVGMGNKNSAGQFSRVKGQWHKFDVLGLTGATYHVDSKVFDAINGKCQEKRESLLNQPSIRGLIEDGAFSGVSERSCKVYPRITTGIGARAYEVKVMSDDEFEL